LGPHFFLVREDYNWVLVVCLGWEKQFNECKKVYWVYYLKWLSGGG
jgi:hypothetical protein